MSNSEIEFKQIRNTIVKGIICTYLPLFIISKQEFLFESLPAFLLLLVFLAIIILFFYGYIICWRAAYKYAKYKGYPGYSGIIAGMLNIFGLSFLFILNNKNARRADVDKNEALMNFDIYSIFVSYITISLLLVPLMIFIPFVIASVENIGIEKAFIYLDNKNFVEILSIPYYFGTAWYLFREIKKTKLNIKQIIGSLNNINFKLPIALFIAEFFFSWGINNITLYGLSFIVPNYVENQINEEHVTTYFGLLAFAISAIIYAPVIEEILFRGIILQKVAIKRNIRAGILISAFLFAVVHFRYDLISLFISGIILAILYLKTKQLIVPIAYHFLNNLIATIWLFHHQFISNYDHSVPITIAEYQQNFIGHIESRILFIALSTPYLIYFLYKNFPRQYNIDKLPYFANQAD